MKKIITSAFVLALTIGAAQAQTTSTPKGNGHKKEHKMQKFDKLNLTAEQKAKLKTLHEQQKKEMQALKNNSSVTKEQKRELHKKYKDQFMAILTPAQQQQLATMKKDRKENGKKGHYNKDMAHGKKGDFKRGANFQKELNLTQDQQDKMAKIRTDFRSQFETLRNDNSLTQEQKRAKMHNLMKQQQEQMKTVLTKEQLEKMQSLRKQRSAKATK